LECVEIRYIPCTPSYFFIGSSLVLDIAREVQNFFQRSGALVVIVAVYLGARSLNKFLVKADKSIKRDNWAQI
jgi:hypothetical protein